ncbi:MAG: hypothetical protein AAFW64_06870 [Pseudomonadota bacterium]
MPSHHIAMDDLGLYVVQLQGGVTLQDELSFLDAVESDPSITGKVIKFVDCRDLGSIELSSAETKGLSDLITNLIDHRIKLEKVVVWAPNETGQRALKDFAPKLPEHLRERVTVHDNLDDATLAAGVDKCAFAERLLAAGYA